MSDALMQRLEGFLGKIFERQREILAEAEAGCAGLRAEFPEDPQPLGNALGAIQAQMHQLAQRIDEAWEKQIEPLFEAQAPAALDRALDRKDDARSELDERWRAFEVRANADFYRALQPRVAPLLARPIPCARCGAVVRERGVVRTEAIPCPKCGAVAQVVPEAAVRMVLGGGAGHAFGEEAALPLRLEVERFRVRVDRERRARGWAPEPLDSLDRWEAMERAAWVKYAEVRAATGGEPVDRELVESRMAAFRKASLETDARWRKAKGYPG